MPTQIKLAVIDNEPLFLVGLEKFFEDIQDILLTYISTNEEELFKKLSKNDLPDVVLLGDMKTLHDKSNLVLGLRRLYPKIKIIILFNKKEIDNQNVIHFMSIGVNACLSKSSDPAEMCTTIKAIKNGTLYFNEILTGVLNSILTKQELKSLENKQSKNKLSDKEKQLIGLICDEESTKDIAVKMNLSYRTIESIRARLYIKLGVKSMVGVALYAAKNNLIV